MCQVWVFFSQNVKLKWLDVFMYVQQKQDKLCFNLKDKISFQSQFQGGGKPKGTSSNSITQQ